LARDVVKHWELREIYRRMGVQLVSPNFEVKEDNDEGWLHETITATFNEYERRTNKRQVVQKQCARLQDGFWPFFPPPGYKSIKGDRGKVLHAVEPEASIIKEALEGYASGRFDTQTDVRDFLRKMKFKGHKEKYKPVYLGQVKRLMNRVIYAGFVEYPKWEVSRRPGAHKGIISR